MRVIGSANTAAVGTSGASGGVGGGGHAGADVVRVLVRGSGRGSSSRTRIRPLVADVAVGSKVVVVLVVAILR